MKKFIAITADQLSDTELDETVGGALQPQSLSLSSSGGGCFCPKCGHFWGEHGPHGECPGPARDGGSVSVVLGTTVAK